MDSDPGSYKCNFYSTKQTSVKGKKYDNILATRK